MFSRTKLTLAGLALTLVAASVAGAQTQKPQSSTQDPAAGAETQRRFGRGEGRRGRARFGHAPLAGLRELNLTADQQQQVRSIMERNLNSTKTLREELRTLGQKRSEGTLTPEDQARAKELHQQMAHSRRGVMAEVQGILTTEQRAQLEEFKKDRAEKGERFGRRRGGSQGPGQKPTTPPQQ
ncbi:MAG: Spy/CpxP family protein refolding chaperone [Acidobacteriota bacterium]